MVPKAKRTRMSQLKNFYLCSKLLTIPSFVVANSGCISFSARLLSHKRVLTISPCSFKISLTFSRLVTYELSKLWKCPLCMRLFSYNLCTVEILLLLLCLALPFPFCIAFAFFFLIKPSPPLHSLKLISLHVYSLLKRMCLDCWMFEYPLNDNNSISYSLFSTTVFILVVSW